MKAKPKLHQQDQDFVSILIYLEVKNEEKSTP